jgi:hypothetical protein
MYSPNGYRLIIANLIELSHRLFNKNNFAVISSPGLMTAEGLTDNSVYLLGKLEITYNLCY